MSSHYGGSNYAASNYLSSHYGRTVVVPVDPEIVHPSGADPAMLARRRRILQEDDELLTLIMAFMNTKDG